MVKTVFRKTYDMFVRPNTSDDFICDEAQDYEPLFVDSNFNDVFADIGANIGAVSKLAKLNEPGLTIIAYEPDDENFDLLDINVSDEYNISIINKAIGNGIGKVELKIDNGSFKAKHSLVDREFKHGYTSRMVDQCDFMSELIENNITIMKIDIEGGEYNLDLSNLPNKIKAFAIEIHLINDNHQAMLDLYLCIKKQFGFVLGEVPEKETIEYFKETFIEKDDAFMCIFLRNTK